MVSTKPNVCISGIGVVSPAGEQVAKHREFLRHESGGLSRRIDGFKASRYIKRRYLRPLDTVTVQSIAMTVSALQDAGIDMQALDLARTGIVVGSMYAGIGCIFDFKQACHEGKESDYLGLSPLYFPGIVFNSLSGQSAIECRFTGPNAVVNAGFSSGLLAVIKGIEYIHTGQADVVIAGGAEMAHPFLDEKYQRRRSDVRLGDMGPSFSYSEAVCLFLLHRAGDPRFPVNGRYAVVRSMSYGFHPDDPQGTSLAFAMQRATAHLQTPPDSVVTCADEDSPLGKRESAALELAFGKEPRRLGNKKHFGHALGAAGSLNLLQGILAVDNGQTLVNSLDPKGSFALLTLERDSSHE